MQSKVTQTRMLNIILFETSAGQRTEDVPVAEAKLVLVECKREQGLISKVIGSNNYYLGNNPGHFTYYKPILISETEKIEVHDWEYDTWEKTLLQSNKPKIIGQANGFRKVLALSEHFSPKHLQAILVGKMKDGDKVLVECEKYYYSKKSGVGGSDHNYFGYQTKLNSSNHITLHKIEEKIYTREELEPLFYKAMLDALNHPERTKGRGLISFHKEWFEQTVK